MGNRSIYQDITLHSVDEFLKLAPPEMCPPDITANDHQLMIQRLSFELAERQRWVRFFLRILYRTLLERIFMDKYGQAIRTQECTCGKEGRALEY